MRKRIVGRIEGMVSRTKIDLIGNARPICLLKCKSTLNQMNTGDTLEVLLGDPGVVHELIAIINRSSDRVVQWVQEGDHFRIQIEKG